MTEELKALKDSMEHWAFNIKWLETLKEEGLECHLKDTNSIGVKDKNNITDPILSQDINFSDKECACCRYVIKHTANTEYEDVCIDLCPAVKGTGCVCGGGRFGVGPWRDFKMAVSHYVRYRKKYNLLNVIIKARGVYTWLETAYKYLEKRQ